MSVVLYLASRERLADWSEHLNAFRKVPDELLDMMATFYSVANRELLRDAVRSRLGNPLYQYNRPFYEMLLSLLPQ